MKAHLDAVKVRLTQKGATFLVWATGPHPYYVLTLTDPRSGAEVPLSSVREHGDYDVRVKAVSGTADGVYTMLTNAKAELSPGEESTDLDVPGASARIRFVRHEFVDVDQDVTITGTDRHPFVGVDTYRIVSQPV